MLCAPIVTSLSAPATCSRFVGNPSHAFPACPLRSVPLRANLQQPHPFHSRPAYPHPCKPLRSAPIASSHSGAFRSMPSCSVPNRSGPAHPRRPSPFQCSALRSSRSSPPHAPPAARPSSPVQPIHSWPDLSLRLSCAPFLSGRSSPRLRASLRPGPCPYTPAHPLRMPPVRVIPSNPRVSGLSCPAQIKPCLYTPAHSSHSAPGLSPPNDPYPIRPAHTSPHRSAPCRSPPILSSQSSRTTPVASAPGQSSRSATRHNAASGGVACYAASRSRNSPRVAIMVSSSSLSPKYTLSSRARCMAAVMR